MYLPSPIYAAPTWADQVTLLHILAQCLVKRAYFLFCPLLGLTVDPTDHPAPRYFWFSLKKLTLLIAGVRAINPIVFFAPFLGHRETRTRAPKTVFFTAV